MGVSAKFKSKELYAKLKQLKKHELVALGLSCPPKRGWKNILIKHFKLAPQVKQRTNKTKKPTKSFYASWEWKKLRYKVIMKYDRQCMCCGASPPNVTLVVDHIKPRSKFPKLEMKEDNLQVLCNSCNMGKSNKDETDFRATEEMRLESETEDYWKNNL